MQITLLDLQQTLCKIDNDRTIVTWPYKHSELSIEDVRTNLKEKPLLRKCQRTEKNVKQEKNHAPVLIMFKNAFKKSVHKKKL